MGLVPNQRVDRNPTHVGDFGAGYWIYPGTCHSLLLSMPHWRTRHGWSGGGPFYQVTDEVKHMGGRSFQGQKFGVIEYKGADVVSVSGVQQSLTIPKLADYQRNWNALQSACWSYVPAGYRATRPGQPMADLGQFLVELRDLPRIPFWQGTRKYSSGLKQGFRAARNYKSLFKRGLSLSGIVRSARQFALDSLDEYVTGKNNLGGEYLNYVFGWKPFVSDLRKIYNLWQNIDKQMAQIVRDNGKGIRRSRPLEKNRTVNNYTTRNWSFPGANCNGWPGWMTAAGGTTQYVSWRSTEETVWYASKYQYYIPDVSSSQWNRKARLALFGALPTPALVWELIPFSWLIDWAVNVEDVVSNMSANAVDNLTCRYAYVMRTITNTQYAQVNTNWGWRGTERPGSLFMTSTVKQTIKTRASGGSPYALNINGSPLTGYQAGVAAALGYNLAH